MLAAGAVVAVHLESMSAAVVVDVAGAALLVASAAATGALTPRPGGPHVTRIYLSPARGRAEERRMLLEAFDSNWIAPVGPDIDAFERELAERVGVGHAVALSSGTAALHLALLLVGVGPGDDVLVPSFTFVASAAAVTYLGANPVFVDCSPSNWNIDPDLVAEELAARARAGPATRAPWSPSTSTGSAPTTTRLTALCDDYEVPLVDDAAEALGATYRGPPGRILRRAPPSSPSTGTRSSPPAAAACWSPTPPSWSTGPGSWPPRPGTRSRTTSTRRSATTTGSAICWPPWDGPSSAGSTAASSAAAGSTTSYRAGLGDVPGIQLHAGPPTTASPTGG